MSHFLYWIFAFSFSFQKEKKHLFWYHLSTQNQIRFVIILIYIQCFFERTCSTFTNHFFTYEIVIIIFLLQCFKGLNKQRYYQILIMYYTNFMGLEELKLSGTENRNYLFQTFKFCLRKLNCSLFLLKGNSKIKRTDAITIQDSNFLI